LKNLQVNLFEYEGKPFTNGILATVFEPIEEIRNERFAAMKEATRKVEDMAGKPSVAVQFGKNIYCVPVNPASLEKTVEIELRGSLLHWKMKEPQELLKPITEKNREIIRGLVAKAVSNQQIERGWFVERYSFVYYWSFALTKQLSTEFMDVFPGFVFRPFIYEDGSCAIMVNPKFKFIPKMTLREKIDQLILEGASDEEIALNFEGEALIDACPVIDCEHRKNPSSSCNLKGAGKRRILSDLDFSQRPSKANIDLIAYHKQSKVCPNNGRLAEFIKDTPPIALIESFGSGNVLSYPLERLREELKLHHLDRFGRVFLMKYMQPPMNERWYLTKSFMPFVDNVRIGRLSPMRLTGGMAEAGAEGKPWANCALFQETPLQFADGGQSLEPFAGLENYGPYDLKGTNRRNFEELQITIFNFSNKLSDRDLEMFYDHFVNGFTFRPHFSGIRRLFRLNVPSFTRDMLRQHTYYAEDIRAEDKPHIAIVVTPYTGNRKVKQYKPLKQKFTGMGIPCQFVLEDNISPRTPKYVGYLKNLALDVYAKAGGIAWTLSRPASAHTLFVGLDTVTRKRKVCTSLQLFNSFGLWLGGWTSRIDWQEYPEYLSQKMREALRVYSKEERNIPSHVVIHKEGEFWSGVEFEPLVNAIRTDCKVVSIKKLGIPRIYDTATRKDFSVKRGTCVQIDRNVAVLTTSGAPHQIKGSQRPLTIEMKNPQADSHSLINACGEIFHLSLVYGGYSLAVTSKPITTHFASRANSLVSQYEIKEDPKLWKKAWFI
jgi:hypothetical protein